MSIERIDTLDLDFSGAIKGAEQTEGTLKELRDQIKTLKTELDKATIGSEEFTNTLGELNQKQATLKEVTTANVSESAKLRKEFKSLKDQLLTLEEGTEEYNQTLSRAAEISQQLQDVNEFVKASASDLGDHIENLSGVMGGLTGGIQAVQGAMNMMGVESEAVEQAIAKLQGLMAITQGLKAIEGAVDPFKRLTTAIKLATVGMSGFKKALISTGIGALVVALGALVANWDKVTEALGFATKEVKENNKEVINLTNSYQQLNNIINSNFDSDSKQLVTLLKDLSTVNKLLKDSKTSLETRFNEGQEFVKQYFNLDSVDAQDIIPKLQEVQQKLQQAINQTNEKIRGKYAQTVKDQQNQEIEDAKKAQQDKISLLQIEIERKEILYGEDYTSSVQYVADMGKVYSEMEKLYQGDVVKLAEIENKKLELRKQAVEESHKLLKAPESTGVTVTTTVEPPKELQSVLPSQDVLDGEATRWEKFTQRLKSGWGDFMDQFDEMSLGDKVQFIGGQISQVGNSLNGLFDSLMEGMDKNNEEYKKLEIAKVITSTLTGIATAIATAWQLGPIAGAIVGPLNAGATLASGIAAINNIKKGALDGSSISNVSNAPTQASKTALESLNQGVNYTNLVEGGSIEESIKNQKVYVLESDISRTQKNVSVIESESTY